MTLKSSRISLYPLSINELEKLLEGDLSISNFIFTDLELTATQKRAMTIKINKIRNVDITKHRWYTYWLIIENDSLKAVGTIGFKGLNEVGTAEVGYGISKIVEGKGYMSESLSTLIEWASSHDQCKLITATNVLINNIGSQKVLEKNGFIKVSTDESVINYELDVTPK